MSDIEDLLHIQRLIQTCAPTLQIQTRGGVYPYEISSKLADPGNFSTSTNAMVGHSVATIGGLIPSSELVGFKLLPDRAGIVNESLRRRARAALARTISHIKEQSRPDRPLIASTAFGDNDPFTLGWLLELLRWAKNWSGADEKDIDDVFGAVVSAAEGRVSDSLRHPSRPVLRFSSAEKSGRAVVHPLPLLRLVQIARLLEQIKPEQNYEDGLAEAFEWFLTHLHLQLSRRSIQHSGFDIAELVFCLEGMLVSGRTRVTRSILDSVVTALNDSRQLNSALRASTPFSVTAVGAVHLFTSIEVVASLLRSVAALSRVDQANFFSSLKPTLAHYLSWLRATMLEGKTCLPDKQGLDSFAEDTPLTFAGWHSEHAHTDDNVVHVWLTSQVLLFLRSYETMLGGDVAAQALKATGLVPELPEYSRVDASTRSAIAASSDPLQLADESPYRVVSRLEEFFVQPHIDGSLKDASYSCLLYGPPGTGKTTLARSVAQNLGWPLLTITTSDFIINGEAQVEARAKAIFQTLERQTNAVIFFDEIDRLLLDRDAPDYTRQGDMLQFMTPSMLTKLNDLRHSENNIFIIGTNYADRIDSAIKRAGRIDHALLVMPPDLARRTTVLRQELARQPSLRQPSEEQLQAAARAGVGRTIAELKTAARNYARRDGLLEDYVREVSPAVTLSTYRKRLAASVSEGGAIGESPKRELLEEAYLLSYLFVECGEAIPYDHDWVAKNWVAVRGQSVIKDATVRDRLESEFTISS